MGSYSQDRGLIYNGRSIGVTTNFAVVKGLRQGSVSEYPWVLRWHKETRIIEPQPHDNHYNYCQFSPVLLTPLSSALSYFPKYIEHLLFLYFYYPTTAYSTRRANSSSMPRRKISAVFGPTP